MQTKKQYLLFIAFIGIMVLYHIFGFIGPYGYDDVHYAQLANNFQNGIIDFDNHFSFRTTIITFTALSYKLFGISDFTSALPSILVSSVILLFVFLLLRKKGNKTLIIGLILTTLNNWYLFYSGKLMPDIYVAMAVFATLFFLHQYRFKADNNTLIYSMLFVIALLFGFMSKGTIILIMPLLLYYFAFDIINKQHYRFWIYTLIGGFVFFAIYFATIWYLTDDLLKRFNAITNNSYLNLCSYNQQPISFLLKRIVYDFFKLSISHELITGYIFVLAYLIKPQSLQVLKMKDSFSFWLTSALILLISSNFMTISLTSYSPMCLDPRHYLFLVPVVAIPASTIINDFIEQKSQKIPLLTLLVIVAAVSFFCIKNNSWYIYVPLFLLFAAYLGVKSSIFSQYMFIIIFAVILMIEPIAMVKYASNLKIRKHKQILNEYVLKQNDDCIVITNEVQKNLGNYYNAFNKGNNISFVDYQTYNNDTTDVRKKILYKSWYSRYLTNKTKQDLPYYAKHISSANQLLYRNKKLNIEIYEMLDFSTPDQSGQLLLTSINTFESETKHWRQNNKLITNNISYEGNFSAQLDKYSPTFEIDIDSLDISNINQLYIKCNLQCNYKNKTEANLIITIKEGKETILWEGKKINNYIKAYSNWWPISHELSIDKEKLKAHSKIGVYVWNIGEQEGYIDNFKVDIFGN